MKILIEKFQNCWIFHFGCRKAQPFLSGKSIDQFKIHAKYGRRESILTSDVTPNSVVTFIAEFFMMCSGAAVKNGLCAFSSMEIVRR